MSAVATPHETTDRPIAGGELLLRVEHLAKSFGPTKALQDCSFELRAGQIHALVGENGSGKSTLVKVLSGVHVPDDGVLVVGDERHASLRNPRTAQATGIATVFQEVLCVEARSVLDNVWLGADGLFRSRVSRERKRAEAEQALAQLLADPPALDTPLEELSLSERQACGIVRALLRRPRVLILDEATSALDVDTRNRLFTTVLRLASEGVGVILITHRMDEIDEIGDRITVMRSGRTVGSLDRGRWTQGELVRLMTGTDSATDGARAEAGSPRERVGDPVLRTRGLVLREGRRPIDLEIRAGELIGLAGLEGHGQDHFIRALWGAGVAAGEVVRPQDGVETPIGSSRAAAAAGIAYVPRERRAEALFEWMSIRENFAVPTLARDRRHGVLRHGRTSARVGSYIDRLKIKLGRPSDAITTLSGGNQQKVIIARWLASNPGILLLNDPTRGIDVGAKRDLYVLLTELAAEGLTVVMLSTEVDEHIELMDRVLVFREHELAREIPRAELTRETLVASYFGEQTPNSQEDVHVVAGR